MAYITLADVHVKLPLIKYLLLLGPVMKLLLLMWQQSWYFGDLQGAVPKLIVRGKRIGGKYLKQVGRLFISDKWRLRKDIV